MLHQPQHFLLFFVLRHAAVSSVHVSATIQLQLYKKNCEQNIETVAHNITTNRSEINLRKRNQNDVAQWIFIAATVRGESHQTVDRDLIKHKGTFDQPFFEDESVKIVY